MAYLIWPQVFILKWIANVVVLLVGTFILFGIDEGLQGINKFSLPIMWPITVLVVGTALFFRFSSYANIGILLIYGAICIIGGLL